MHTVESSPSGTVAMECRHGTDKSCPYTIHAQFVSDSRRSPATSSSGSETAQGESATTPCTPFLFRASLLFRTVQCLYCSFECTLLFISTLSSRFEAEDRRMQGTWIARRESPQSTSDFRLTLAQNEDAPHRKAHDNDDDDENPDV